MSVDIQGCADLAKERSENLMRWRCWLRLLSFALTIPVAYFRFEWWEALLVLLPEAFGCVLEGMAKEWFRRHRKWRGAGLICDSFGTAVSTELVNEVESKLGERGLEKVKAHKRSQDDPYYTSKAPHGMQRLMENVQESVHYSARLSQHSHRRLLFWPVISGILILVFILCAPQFGESIWAAEALIMILAALAISDTVKDYFEYRKAEGEFRALEALAEKAAKNPQVAGEVLGVLADYVLISALSLPLDTILFQEKKKQLQASWNSRK